MNDKDSWGPRGSTPHSDSNGPASPMQDPSTGTSTESSGKGTRTAIIVVAALAIIALIGGGAWALTGNKDSDGSSSAEPNFHSQENSSEETTEGAASEEESTPEKKAASTQAKSASTGPSTEEKCGALANDIMDAPSGTLQLFCDGTWLYLAQKQSSNYGLFYWTDNEWKLYRSDNTTGDSVDQCYDKGKLDTAGAPKELTNQLPLCDAQQTQTPKVRDRPITAEEEFPPEDYWYGECDGSYVLIAESVIIPPATDPISEPYRVHKKHPGSKIIPGSACSSLRSHVEGGTVYAIVYEAGHSVEKVCELKAKYGGNARSLNNDADFSDPANPDSAFDSLSLPFCCVVSLHPLQRSVHPFDFSSTASI